MTQNSSSQSDSSSFPFFRRRELIFIAQNTESAEFAFLNLSWSLPLGVAILFAAVAGGLLTVAVGAVRIFQLRRAAKKNLKAGL